MASHTILFTEQKAAAHGADFDASNDSTTAAFRECTCSSGAIEDMRAQENVTCMHEENYTRAMRGQLLTCAPGTPCSLTGGCLAAGEHRERIHAHLGIVHLQQI